MFQMIISGKPSNFEFVDKSLSETLGACFCLTEKGWDGKAAYERRWVVWVPNHKVKWAEKKTRKPEYSIVVVADWVDCGAGGIWACRATEIADV